MRRPPISRQQCDNNTIVDSKSEIMWESKPYKDFYMQGGRWRYTLFETKYNKVDDSFFYMLVMDRALESPGWGSKKATAFHLVAYPAEEGIGNRVPTADYATLIETGVAKVAAYWDDWPSDKKIAEAIYDFEGIDHI
jgi:hypothetical protein